MTTTIPSTPTWMQSIKDKLSAAYAGIWNAIKSPFIGLANYFKPTNPDKAQIDALRNKQFQLIAQEAKSSKPDFMKVTKSITKDTKAYIQSIIDQEVKKLGKPPCEFNVITLGSMARQETGPITDLEIGFLVKEKTVDSYKYFYQLSQNISDRLFLLGEHPDIGGKGLRMDEADNAPPHLRFEYRNATNEQLQELVKDAIMNRQWDKIPYEGSRPYLATPEEFASYSKPVFAQNKQQLKKAKEVAFEAEWKKAQRDPKNKKLLQTADGKAQLQKEIRFWLDQIYRPFNSRELRTANDAGKKLGRNMELLYGNNAMYKRFMQARERHFSQKQANGKTHRQNIAINKMVEDIQEVYAKGKSIYLTGELGKTLDIKRELYRFIEQFVTNLGFYHQCKHQNTLDIVRELKAKGILSAPLAAQMEDFIQFASGLRLKEQSVIKRQGFAAYFDQNEFDEDKADLEKEIKNLEVSIAFLQKGGHQPELVATKQRDLFKLKVKLEHLLDMAPGKIYSAEDIKQLKDKYLPMAKQLFQFANEWTQGKQRLGFQLKDSSQPKPVIDAVKSQPILPLLQAKQAAKPALKQALLQQVQAKARAAMANR